MPKPCNWLYFIATETEQKGIKMGRKTESIHLPAIRGMMGPWVFYTTTMTFKEISERIELGSELFKHKGLSKMVQRVVKSARAGEISNYLIEDEERFFPAMIVAVYGGKPKWLDVSIRRQGRKADIDTEILDGAKSDTLGFLSLTGKERLFPLDGQHRLSGIRNALRNPDADQIGLFRDEMTVILVSHQHTDAGRIRSRHLFTTLNKKAVSVKKNEIIALDEGDMMAIVTRRLVEDYGPFSGDKVNFHSETANTQKGDTKSFITIFTIYDTLCDLFPVLTGEKSRKLKTSRMCDEDIEILFECSKAYFSALIRNFPEVNDCLCGDDPERVISMCRSQKGGHMLFRTVGQKIFSAIARAAIDEEISKMNERPNVFSIKGKRIILRLIDDAISRFSNIPVRLDGKPYADLIFDPDTQKIAVARDKIVRDIILYRFGLLNSKDTNGLKDRIQRSIGRDEKINNFLW